MQEKQRFLVEGLASEVVDAYRDQSVVLGHLAELVAEVVGAVEEGSD